MPIFLGIYYNGTKNVPWHILATSAVVYDIFPLRASAHPAGGFLSYRKAISYTIKNRCKAFIQLSMSDLEFSDESCEVYVHSRQVMVPEEKKIVI